MSIMNPHSFRIHRPISAGTGALNKTTLTPGDSFDGNLQEQSGRQVIAPAGVQVQVTAVIYVFDEVDIRPRSSEQKAPDVIEVLDHPRLTGAKYKVIVAVDEAGQGMMGQHLKVYLTAVK